jgi:hypothetical protein
MKSKLVSTLLNGFLGGWGIHRFYLGKIGTGIIWLLTGGCFGIGTIVDMFKHAKNTMTDKNGQPLKADDCPNWLPWLFFALQICGIVCALLALLIAGGSILALIGLGASGM